MKNKAYLLPACKTADGVPIGIGSEVYAITFKQKVNKYGRLYRPSTRVGGRKSNGVYCDLFRICGTRLVWLDGRCLFGNDRSRML